MLMANRSNPKKPTVNATLAYACLQSVPLDAEGDRLQLDGLRAFAQFQSTLAYLKSPPPGYLYPPVDVLEALDLVSQKLENNGYQSEFDFQMDVSSVIASGYDGHFSYKADITTIFGFLRLNALYSVSKDGLALPEVYLDVDLPMLVQKNASNYTASPISQINGQNVEAWMNSYATLNGGGQDPDSNYNAMFFTVPWGQNGFRGGYHYDGPCTSVTFRNGTSRIVEHLATTKANFTGVESGSDFFNKFCTGADPTGSDGEETSPTPSSTSPPAIPTTEVPFQTMPSQTAEPGPSFFPVPYITMEDNSVAGYFPDENPDLAVLAIASFAPEPSGIEAYNQFANVVRTFLATSQKLGKKKLAIDLRGNPGGDVILGYDLFAQLFPKMTPYGATNFRATPLLNDVGMIVSDYYANITNVTASESDCDSDFSTQPFNYREELDVDNKPFTSWQDLYGPQQHNNDNFTNLMRYNLNDKFSVGCQNISNYGNITNITPQVFQPEDVILIQDGFCASTCAVFSEFMKSQANVKQIVFGGRKQTGPMQAVGGVKGANVYKFDSLLSWIDQASTNLSTPAQKESFEKRYSGLEDGAIQMLTRAAIGPDGLLVASANVRNNIRLDDDTVTPLQFVYEAADCRLFYTAPMLAMQSLVWSAAYNSMWKNGSCVAGSTGHPSSKPGCDVASNRPPPNARNFFGATIHSVFPEDLGNNGIGMRGVQDKRKKPKFQSHSDKNSTHDQNSTQVNAAMLTGGGGWNGALLGSALICSMVAVFL